MKYILNLRERKLMSKTLPAKWDDIKHRKGDTEDREGTRPHDLHPEEDETLGGKHHTHCCDCDYPFEGTHHFFGDGIVCDYCSIEKLYEGILKHNTGDCDCPDGHFDKDEKLQWGKQDCLALYEMFEEIYNKVIKEL